MRDKFLNLKQGGMSVTAYLNKFTTWGRYTPNDIDTMRRRERDFLTGYRRSCRLTLWLFTILI
jgi:hypothetical protein